MCGAPLPRSAGGGETCEIVLWRGYTKSEFVAVGAGGETLARSEQFRWRRDAEPPAEEPYLAAHAELVASLLADGWERSDDGEEWYAARFARPGRA